MKQLISDKQEFIAVLGTAILFLIARFLFLGDTLFIADEAKIQLIITDHMNAGTIPLFGLGGSSLPTPYGAFALWVYGAVRFVTDHPYALVFSHLVFHAIGFGLFFWSMQMLYDKTVASWSLLLAASSPFLFFFSRFPWDNTLLVFSSSLVLLGVAKFEFDRKMDRTFSYLPWIIAAIGIGIGINTHLMIGPVAIAFFMCLLLSIRLFPMKKSIVWCSLIGSSLIVLFVAGPYLIALIPKVMNPGQYPQGTAMTDRWGDGRALWWNFAQSTLYLSTWKFKFVFKDQWQYFINAVPSPVAFFFAKDIFGWITRLIVYFVLLGTPIFWFRKKKSISLTLCFGICAWSALLLVYQYLNIPTGMHYYLNIWFVPFLAIAYFMHNFSDRWVLGTKILIALLVLTNGTYLLYFQRFLHQNHGVRTVFVDSTIGEKRRALTELCTKMKKTDKLEVRVGLKKVHAFPQAMQYLAQYAQSCSSPIKIEFTKSTKSLDWEFSYPTDSATSARLILQRVSHVN